MKRRLNILYIVNTIRETSSPLHEHVSPMSVDHNVVVCSYESIEAELPSGITCISGEGNVFKFIRALNNTISSERHDIIHFHAPYSAVVSLFYGLISRSFKNKSTVYTVHSSYSGYRMAHLAMLYFVFLNVDKIVHCSNASFDSFSEKIKGLFLNKRVAIPNGVNLKFVEAALEKEDRDYSKQKDEVNQDQITKIITIGRLITLKNHSLLLQSLAKIKNTNFSLQIIGTGPLLDTLVSELKDLEIESKVIFTGVIPREEVYRELAESDLFLSASTLEGLPLSVLEALACSCPVILSDIPAHREVLSQDDCVQIVESNDTSGFVPAIDHFMALSSEQLQDIRQQCREHVTKNHSMRVMNEKYLELYKNSLNG